MTNFHLVASQSKKEVYFPSFQDVRDCILEKSQHLKVSMFKTQRSCCKRVRPPGCGLHLIGHFAFHMGSWNTHSTKKTLILWIEPNTFCFVGVKNCELRGCERQTKYIMLSRNSFKKKEVSSTEFKTWHYNTYRNLVVCITVLKVQSYFSPHARSSSSRSKPLLPRVATTTCTTGRPVKCHAVFRHVHAKDDPSSPVEKSPVPLMLELHMWLDKSLAVEGCVERCIPWSCLLDGCSSLKVELWSFQHDQKRE